MSACGTYLQEWVLHAGKHDDKYQKLKHMIQQHATNDHDVDYHLMEDGLVRFMNRIYVLYDNELKKLSLREFHVKLYSCHLGYHNTLTIAKKLYYWPDLKKEMFEFIVRCLDCQQVTTECKHPASLL